MATPAAPPRSFRAAGATEAMRAAALGANLWVIALVLPMAHGGVRGTLDLLLAPLPLAPLALGAVALAGNGHAGRRLAAVIGLLVGFPVALAGVVATRADLADRDAWGALGLAALGLSALAFGAVAAEACARPLGLRASTATSLPTLVETEPPARAWLRRGVIGAATLGGLAIAVVAPALGARATLLRAWGEAADEATVLASIVGAGAGAFALAALIGPRLRAPRAGEARRVGPARIVLALAIAVLALLATLALRAAGGAPSAG